MAGPDGNVWFTETEANKIGKVTTSGVLTEYPVPTPNSEPSAIAAGPDGEVWFTERKTGKIGKIGVSGVFSEYLIPTPGSHPTGITAAADGNMWFCALIENFAASSFVAKITPSGTITEYTLGEDSGTDAITAGPDGNVWVTHETQQVARVTPSGAISQFEIADQHDPHTITVGSDGNLWFTEVDFGFCFACELPEPPIGMMTTSGVYRRFYVPMTSARPEDIANGPDGNLWISEYEVSGSGFVNFIARLTTSGKVTEFTLPEGFVIEGITAGPDGNLWLTESDSFTGSRTVFDHVVKLVPPTETSRGF